MPHTSYGVYRAATRSCIMNCNVLPFRFGKPNTLPTGRNSVRSDDSAREMVLTYQLCFTDDSFPFTFIHAGIRCFSQLYGINLTCAEIS